MIEDYVRGSDLDMDADKGFLEEDLYELLSEGRFIITKRKESKGRGLAERPSR